MKKTILLIIFYLNFVSIIKAQFPTVSVGKLLCEKGTRYINLKLIGYSDESAYYYYYTTTSAHLEEYDIETLELLGDNVFDLPGDQKTIKRIENTYNDRIHNCIYFITSAYSKDNNEYKLYGFSMNYENEKSEIHLLDEMSYTEFLKIGKYNSKCSYNNQHFLIYHDLKSKTGNTASIKLKLFDLQNWKELWKKQIKFPEKENKFNIDTLILNNHGTIFIGASNRGKKRQIQSIQVSRYSKDNDVIDRTMELAPEHTAVDYALFINKQNNINFLALYGVNHEDKSKGYYLIRMDESNLEKIGFDKRDFTYDEMLPLMSKSAAKKLKGISNLRISTITPLSDSGFVISAELYFAIQEVENAYTIECEKDNIISTKISYSGELSPSILVTKAMYHSNYKNPDYFVFEMNNEIIYCFWDAKSNFKKNMRISIANPTFGQTPIVFVMAKINKEGVITYNIYDQYLKTGTFTHLDKCFFVRDDKSEILLMSGNSVPPQAYAYTLTKITLKK